MVETITIRPEPLTPLGAAAPSVTRASAALESREPPIAFEDLATQEYYGMVKSGGSASELVSRPTDFFTATAGSGEDEFSFYDFLDVINPLQHIPVVSTIYRELTGDTIKPAIKLAGSALLGGVTGLVTGVVDAVVATETGKDIGQNMLAMLGAGDGAEARTQFAKAKEPEEKQKTASNDVKPASVQLASVPQAPLVPGYNTAQIAEMSALPSPTRASSEDRDVMALFGGSAASAHKSYQKANMMSYLGDVTRSNSL